MTMARTARRGFCPERPAPRDPIPGEAVPLTVIGATVASQAARFAVRLGAETGRAIVAARSGGVALIAVRGPGDAALAAAARRASHGLAFVAAEEDGALCTAEAWPRLVDAAGDALAGALAAPGRGDAAASFAIVVADHAAVARAWGMLALGEEADSETIDRRWRCLAFALDPGRGGPLSAALLRGAERAHRLLAALARRHGGTRFGREALAAVGGEVMILPRAPEAGEGRAARA